VIAISNDRMSLKEDTWSRGFGFPIESLLQFGNVVVVLLKPAQFSDCPANVFGLSVADGSILWQAQNVDWFPDEGPHRYMGIRKVNEKLVQLYHSHGYLFDIDPQTGKVMKRTFVK
jgi:hypothetical protein